MFGLLAKLEKQFYDFRDFLWDYPDTLLLSPSSLYTQLKRVYRLTRPYSHILAAVAVCVSLILLAFSPALLAARGSNTILIEGVVMGTNVDGSIQAIDTVTPLLTPRYQLNADIQTLIYEPLWRINKNGGVEYQLATSVTPLVGPSGKPLEGVAYQIKLRADVFWHDGTRFTANDVVATFGKIVELASDELGDSKVVANRAEALKQMEISALDDFTLQVALRADQGSGVTKLFTNYLELLTFKIMPGRYLSEINPNTVNSPDAAINRRPVGTGPYRFESARSSQIVLKRFASYYLPPSGNIATIEFQLFKTEESLTSSLKNGEIHSFVASTAKFERDLDRYPKITTHLSGVLTNQYWAIYFDTEQGTDYLREPKLRRALAQAINYDLLLKAILSRGERAYGPIHTASQYFNKAAPWPTYDPAQAEKTITELGWQRNAAFKFVKDNQPLTINIKYVDNYDRGKVIESVKQDWEAIGVTVEIEAYPLTQFKNEVLLGSFDTILYGMNTFIDPDRYELFHSSASQSPGLNISKYRSSDQTQTIDNKKIVNIPKTDRLLEVGRSTLDFNLRKQEYDVLQEYLATDVPVIFLYHPQYSYQATERLTGVNIQDVGSIEDRFLTIANWNIR